ncbi:hypothetical protein [Halobaculum sp. P14]|uniref:hypothetical protein n=1 Tax=Halobaculum sp. P14 TaxID=3421638 RepID=UPI003EB7E902
MPSDESSRATYRRYVGDPDEHEYGDERVGYNVPTTVRRGGATRPMQKEPLAGNGTAYKSHSVAMACEECYTVRYFATSHFVTAYNCRVCGAVRWFFFGWGLNSGELPESGDKAQPGETLVPVDALGGEEQ